MNRSMRELDTIQHELCSKINGEIGLDHAMSGESSIDAQQNQLIHTR